MEAAIQADSELTGRVIGAAIAVHRELGPGYLEAVYESALCIELDHLTIPYARQIVVEVGYRGRPVGEGRIDLLVDGWLVVELKAVETILPIHEAQVLSYLKATGHPVGLLINFNVVALRRGIRRVVNGFSR